jgi:type I restriction enzyme S subunit
VAAILKRFRQAVLAAATSGELTREWREERGAPEWDTKSLGDCGAVTGGITKNTSRVSLPLQKPYLRVANVYLNCIDIDDVSVIGVTETEYRKTVLRSGDLLIVEGNGSLRRVGRVAIWESTELGCVHQNHLIRWRSEGMMPKWALYWLMSPVGRQLLEKRAKSTTGLHTLSVSKVSGIPIPVPSIAEQDEIIFRAQDLFTLADQLEARLTAARKIIDRLTPALLAKAFRGELVPQDPTDEPASVLLERIRAARQAEAGASKPSRRGRPKAAANPDQLPLDAAPVPPDFLAGLLRECGPLSERALLAASELQPERFEQQLFRELERGTAREVQANGQVLLEAAG